MGRRLVANTSCVESISISTREFTREVYGLTHIDPSRSACHCFTHLPHAKRHDVLMKAAFLTHSPLAAQPWQAAPASSAQSALARGSAAGAGGGAGLSRRARSDEEKTTVSLRCASWLGARRAAPKSYESSRMAAARRVKQVLRARTVSGVSLPSRLPHTLVRARARVGEGEGGGEGEGEGEGEGCGRVRLR